MFIALMMGGPHPKSFKDTVQSHLGGTNAFSQGERDFASGSLSRGESMCLALIGWLLTLPNPPRPVGTPPKGGSTSGGEAKSSLLRSHNAAPPKENPILGGVAGALAEVGVGRELTRPTNNYMHAKHVQGRGLG